MPRPKRHRKMGRPPIIKGFRPFGGKGQAGSVEILFEEYEALKLADYDMYSQADAAREMGVSRPTFTRIYDSVLKKIARAFVENKQIVLEGGNVSFDEEWFRCKSCNNTFRMPSHGKEVTKCPVCSSGAIENVNEQIRKSGDTQGVCECMECGHQEKHTPGTPCREMTCPECGGQMRRPKKRES